MTLFNTIKSDDARMTGAEMYPIIGDLIDEDGLRAIYSRCSYYREVGVCTM